MKEHRLSNDHPMVSVILALMLSAIFTDSIAKFAKSFYSYINGGSHLSTKEL